MIPVWQRTSPLLRSFLPGLQNSLSRSSSLYQAPVFRGFCSPSPLLLRATTTPLTTTTPRLQQLQQLPCLQQQQLWQLQQQQPQHFLSSRFYSSGEEKNQKEGEGEGGEAEELLKRGKELFEKEDYKGSYSTLLEAYDNFEKQDKIQHLLIVSTLIFNVCKKGGLENEKQAFIKRAHKNDTLVSKEEEEERKEFEKKAKGVMEQTTEIYQLQNKGKGFMGKGQFEEAKKAYWEALKLADHVEPVNHGLVALLNAQCGAIQGHIGEYEEAETHLRASLRNYKKVVGANFYLKEYLETLRLMGDLFMKRRRFASAVKEYEVYAEEAKKYRSFRDSWDGMLLMADCTIKMDDFDKGFEIYDNAIHYSKTLQMNSCHIETHIRIGQVKEFLNKPEEGLRHYQSGLALARRFGLVEHQAKCLLHVGNLHRMLKNNQIADAHLRLAKDLITTSKLHHLSHLVDFYLGKLLLEIGNLTDSEICLKKAIETSKQRDINVYRSSLCDYGAILVKQEKPAEAIPLFEEALDFNTKFQDHAGMMRCYSHMLHAYRDMGKEREEKEATHRLTELNTILQKKGIAVPLDHNQ